MICTVCELYVNKVDIYIYVNRRIFLEVYWGRRKIIRGVKEWIGYEIGYFCFFCIKENEGS